MNMKEETWDLRKAIRQVFEDADYGSQTSKPLIDRLCAEITSKMPCAHVVSSDEGTSYCNLAESSVTQLGNELFKCKEHLDLAWGVIANVRDWDRESNEWQEAAARWRDEYYKLIAIKKDIPRSPPS